MLVIGSRGSQLALWQANHIKAKLEGRGLPCTIEIIHTRGDKILDVPLAKVGGKGLFTKEIEDALLDGRIHLAVHSLKDLPTQLPEGLVIAAIPERADPLDAIIGSKLRLLRPGAVVVEDDGIVQYAVLVRDRTMVEGAGITLPSLTPIANSQAAVRVVLEASTDTIVVAGARRAARRWRVTASSGDPRLVWADLEGRLLRLTIPARNLEALRDDVPR
jgi:hypothetical protein